MRKKIGVPIDTPTHPDQTLWVIEEKDKLDSTKERVINVRNTHASIARFSPPSRGPVEKALYIVSEW